MRSTFRVSAGSPSVCSTLTSAAPATLPSTRATCRAASAIASVSSPKTLTATSLRTPEISSLKRSWIGCENS